VAGLDRTTALEEARASQLLAAPHKEGLWAEAARWERLAEAKDSANNHRIKTARRSQHLVDSEAPTPHSEQGSEDKLPRPLEEEVVAS